MPDPIAIKGLKVNNETHKVDYNELANKPTIRSVPAYDSSQDAYFGEYDKVLAINSTGDNYKWVNGLPVWDTQYDVNKALVVNSTGDGYKWGYVIPDYDMASDGDVLKISSGVPAWDAVEGLPASSSYDIGKILTVKALSGDGSFEVAWDYALPQYDSQNEGDVLSVNSLGELIWDTPSGGSEELPSYDYTNAGDVLSVDDQGELEWVTPSGGGSGVPSGWDSAGMGAVLMVVGDSDEQHLGWDNLIPLGAMHGEFLTVNYTGELIWQDLTNSLLPTYDTSTDTGKVLTVTANGAEWITPGN